MGTSSCGFDAHFARVDAHFARIDVQFAELRAEMHKGFGEMTKWIVGTVVGVSAVTITIMSFVFNNAVLKARAAPAQAAPIVVYTQPAPPAPVVPQPKP